MEFVNPGFLYGLFALAIPVIIHLFNFRRFKKVYFTNVKFLSELKQQTQKQSRLRHLLVLLMRMLAIAALVIAFAQPYIPVSKSLINKSARNIVSVYIDNSFSMQAESDKGTLLDKAKARALEIARVYKNSDRFQVLTNDFEGKHQRFVSKDEFGNLIDEVVISPATRNLAEVIARQSDLLSTEQAGVKSVYLISDFQKNMMEEKLPVTDSSVNIFIIPVESVNKNNLYIDSCWFDAPVYQVDQQAKLKVRIRNSSDIDYEKIPLKLKIGNVQKALASFDVKAGQEAEVELVYTNQQTGIQSGELEINDYPISFDDKFFFSYYVSPVTKVLSINGNGQNIYLNSLFGHDSTFVFRNADQGNLDYSSLPSNQLIILNEADRISTGLGQELKRFVSNGGSLVVFPSANINTDNYREFLTSLGTEYYSGLDTARAKVSFIDIENPLYSGVFDEMPENIDLPVVFKSYVVEKKSRIIKEVLMEMQNGNSFLSEYPAGSGRVYLFAVPSEPEFSNFPKHAIFVPTLFKMAIMGYKEDRIFYMIGDDKTIVVNNVNPTGDNIFKIKLINSGFELIPDQRIISSQLEIYPHDRIKIAGNYLLTDNDKPVKGLSFNYNRSESEMVFYTADQISEELKDSGIDNFHIVKPGVVPFEQAVSEMSRGVRLWMWFVIFALVFLGIEVLLLRLFH